MDPVTAGFLGWWLFGGIATASLAYYYGVIYANINTCPGISPD